MMRWTLLERILFTVFLFWFACGLVFTLGRIGPETAAGWPLPELLQKFVQACLWIGDSMLILLAFANTHLLAARHWGATLARRWALLILVLSLTVETIGTLTGFPFGAYSYTNRFGPMLGVVPMTIPLAWHVVLTNSLFIVRALSRDWPRWGEAAAAGGIATLYDAVLEPFAVRIKGYWFWRNAAGAVPWQNYAAWFVIASILVLAFAPPQAALRAREIRPVFILGSTVLLFLAGLLMRAVH